MCKVISFSLLSCSLISDSFSSAEGSWRYLHGPISLLIQFSVLLVIFMTLVFSQFN